MLIESKKYFFYQSNQKMFITLVKSLEWNLIKEMDAKWVSNQSNEPAMIL